MKEYKMGKFWAALIYIGGLLLITLFGFLLFMPFLPGFKNDIQTEVHNYFLAPLSIIMIVVFVLGILDTAKGKFIIDTHKITRIGAFSKREILLHDIKGYRINDKFILIESKREDQKTIKIALQTANLNDIKDWLKNEYPNLDVQQKKNEKKDILNNPNFGGTKKEREELLQRTAKTVRIFNWIGGIAAVCAFFFPKPYWLVVGSCILFPIIALIIVKYYKGLVQIDSRENSSYPSIFAGLFFPSTALFIRTLLDFNILDYSNIWLPMTVIALVLMALFMIGNSEFQLTKVKEVFSVLFLMFLMAEYSYGVVIFTNCTLDTSEPVHFHTKVLNKRTSTGKSTSYYLELTAWGDQKNPDEVSVTQEEYKTYTINDPVNVYFMKGNFEIPWYEISK
ncbi:hypothetical protein [Flavobacterium hungaricum]|uniref:PH domain-containing protein n=1 Tax=Flavobacterium hungaricum TaxID=2082725 RepID=A0ABR9TSJ0_9FLAO|nr:hypothetical protein [Flavobacterium hungaricum]MBE8728308.1 hypothetical protein [Flavobacterium hungaricum]